MNRIGEYQVSGKNADGSLIQAKLVRVTRYVAVVEIYDPDLVLRASQTLTELKIDVDGTPVYSGRGIVASVINVDSMLLCEIKLADEGFQEGVTKLEYNRGITAGGLEKFLAQWAKGYRIATAYKVVVGDMFSFFSDLRYWMNQVELGLGKMGLGALEREGANIVDASARKILPIIDGLFARFEEVVESLPVEARALHGSYMRRQLHPLLICSPFAYRTFTKPLGYAGDYEMINMIVRNGYEGSSLFAKIINHWFVRQPPAVAHRNRLVHLSERIVEESLRGVRKSRPTKILNLACGPAWEVQRLLVQPERIRNAEFTLLDFNEETLQYTKGVMDQLQRQHSGSVKIDYVKKSVHRILMEAGRSRETEMHATYDFVYCAGLFDYLSDQVCGRLLALMYEWVLPGGLIVATNVETSNPLKHGMDQLLEWHLNCRRAVEFRKLAPTKAHDDDVRLLADETGVNIIMEVRKPYAG